MNGPVFLKWGGSLITDKGGEEAACLDVIDRLGTELRRGLGDNPGLRLVLGHGSGSFGHVAGARYQTRDGVRNLEQWRGFSEVAASAARLHGLVRDSLLAQGVSALSVPPSSTAICKDGTLVDMEIRSLNNALEQQLVPVVYGDVAFDASKGGTIVSTEEVFNYLALRMNPSWILIAGITDGVLDASGKRIPLINSQNIGEFTASLGASEATDVTGGMAAKVVEMLALISQKPEIRVRIFSGSQPGNVRKLLGEPEQDIGTLISS